MSQAGWVKSPLVQLGLVAIRQPEPWAAAQKAQFGGSLTLPMCIGWKAAVLSLLSTFPFAPFSFAYSFSTHLLRTVLPQWQLSFSSPICCFVTCSAITFTPTKEIGISRLWYEQTCHFISCFWLSASEISCDSFLLHCLLVWKRKQLY